MSNQIRVSFLLPCSGIYRCGGFKVIYEHANRLAQRGYQVAVVHGTTSRDISLRQWLPLLREYLRLQRNNRYRPDQWFKLDPSINVSLVPMLHPRMVPDADVVVASSWHTAEWAMNYPLRKGRKMYLVHDYEYYMNADEAIRHRMARTYQAEMQAIYTSPVVKQMLAENGNKGAVEVTNGIDFGIFYQKLPFDAIERTTIGFPTRAEPFKATQDAVRALDIVREKLGRDLRIWTFGNQGRALIPDWVEFVKSPDDARLRTLYNQTSVFVVPSHYEGWGLPGAEAMACGAALVSTDNGGCRAYAHHNDNALLSPPGEPDALAKNVLKLLEDQELRLRLARRGHEHVQQFNWQLASETFESVLQRVIAS